MDKIDISKKLHDEFLINMSKKNHHSPEYKEAYFDCYMDMLGVLDLNINSHKIAEVLSDA